MGQTLSTPATEKNTESGGNDRFLYVVSEMQGWRITMEDAHTIALRLDEDEESENSNAFFAVYDGHGGGNVARYAGRNVHKRLTTQEEYQEKRYPEALKRAFLGTDEDMLADPAFNREPSGSTAIAALITSDNKIYAANAGDSRGVLCSKGQAIPLSHDHKPGNTGERERIVAAGGYIEYGRVNGNLALARALGDFDFKKNYKLTPEQQIITSNPDITENQITEDDEFIVLACDGIWDCLSSQDVVNIIRLKIAQGEELGAIAEFICDHCLAPTTNEGTGVGCDNMTLLIVALLHGRTKEQWYEWVKDRVDKHYGYKTPSEVREIYHNHYNRPWKRTGANAVGPNPVVNRLMDLSAPHGITITPVFGSDSDGGLMFETDSEEEDISEDEAGGTPFFSQTFGGGNSNQETSDDEHPSSPPFSEEESNDAPSKVNGGSAGAEENRLEEADVPTSDEAAKSSSSQEPQGEASPPSKPLPNGDAVSRTPDQFESHPAGDEPSAVVKAEGLMDTSESPLKG